MRQQGDTGRGHEDDWWRQLYETAEGDTGGARAQDSLDDRFASAAGTLRPRMPRPHRPRRGERRGGAQDGPGAAAGGGGDRAAQVPNQGQEPADSRVVDPPQDRRPSREDRSPLVTGPGAGADSAAAGNASAAAGPQDSSAHADPDSAPVPVDPRGPLAAPLPDLTDEAALLETDSELLAEEARSAGRDVAPAVAGAAEVTAPVPTDLPDVPDSPGLPDRGGSELPRVPGPLRSAPFAGASAPEAGPAQDAPRDEAAVAGFRAGEMPVPPPAPPAVPLRLSRAPWEPPAEGAEPLTFAHRTPAPPAAEEAPFDAGPALSADVDSAEARPAHVGDGPPTYQPEPTTLRPSDPEELREQVPDTVLDGARFGDCVVRAASVRGDSARYRGEPRRDHLLLTSFGTGDEALVLLAMATGTPTGRGGAPAALDACLGIAEAVGRSHSRLSEDIRGGVRSRLKPGLQRLTERSLGRLRPGPESSGAGEWSAGLRCLLLPADPLCRTRVFFGTGGGGLLRLREGAWEDIDPVGQEADGPEGLGGQGAQDPATLRLPPSGSPAWSADAPGGPPGRPSQGSDARAPFRFGTCTARPGDVLLLCTAGLAAPLQGEPALAGLLARRWAGSAVPGLADFFADVSVRAKGYAGDRTAAALWEA